MAVGVQPRQRLHSYYGPGNAACSAGRGGVRAAAGIGSRYARLSGALPTSGRCMCSPSVARYPSTALVCPGASSRVIAPYRAWMSAHTTPLKDAGRLLFLSPPPAPFPSPLRAARPLPVAVGTSSGPRVPLLSSPKGRSPDQLFSRRLLLALETLLVFGRCSSSSRGSSHSHFPCRPASLGAPDWTGVTTRSDGSSCRH